MGVQRCFDEAEPGEQAAVARQRQPDAEMQPR
jgi:hypothetical protein